MCRATGRAGRARITRDGKRIDVVALAGKTGFLYVFDRVTGTPIWPIEERPVPKSDMPGEQILADAALSDQPAAIQQTGVHGGRHQSPPDRQQRRA
jgi:glucose dehydrogenase